MDYELFRPPSNAVRPPIEPDRGMNVIQQAVHREVRLKRKRLAFAAWIIGFGCGATGGFLGGALVGSLGSIPAPQIAAERTLNAEDTLVLEKTLGELQRSVDFWRAEAVACQGPYEPPSEE